MKEGERIECEFKYVLIINIQIFRYSIYYNLGGLYRLQREEGCAVPSISRLC